MGRPRRSSSRFVADDRRLKRRLLVMCGVVALILAGLLFNAHDGRPLEETQPEKPQLTPFTLVPPPTAEAGHSAPPAALQADKAPRAKGKRARRRAPVDLPAIEASSDPLELGRSITDAAAEPAVIAPAPPAPPPPPTVIPASGTARVKAPHPGTTGTSGRKKTKKSTKRITKVVPPAPPKEDQPTGVTVHPGESTVREVKAHGVD